MLQPRPDTRSVAVPTGPVPPTAAQCAAANVSVSPFGHRGTSCVTRAPHRARALRLIFASCLALAGFALIGQTAWDQWGSGWYANRAQVRLAATLISDNPTMSPGAGLATLTPSPTPNVVAPAIPDMAEARPALRSALAKLTIPRLGLSVIVVTGTDRTSLREGPGWMTTSAALGRPGNAVISGHRTTYGAPFRHLDALAPGDQIIVSRPGHSDDIYELRSTLVVAPGDTWVARPTPGVRLTLTTCHPAGSDKQRLVLQAELVSGEAVAAALSQAAWQPSAP